MAKRNLGPAEKLRSLSALLRFSTATLDALTEQVQPFRKYAPDKLDKLERLFGETAVQIDAAAEAADDAADALNRLMIGQGTPPDRE